MKVTSLDSIVYDLDLLGLVNVFCKAELQGLQFLCS